MNPSSLLNVPCELLRERAGDQPSAAPMAASRERWWATLACAAFIALSIALIVALH